MFKARFVLLCLLTLAGAGCGSGEEKPPVTPSPQAALSLSIGSTEWTVQAGNRLELPVSVERTGGHEGPVQLELRGLPATFLHSQARLEPGETSAVLEVTPDVDVAAGTYPAVVAATSGDLSDTKSISLVVTARPVAGSIRLAFEPARPQVLKGGTHELTVVVERSGGQTPGFRIEAGQPAPWLTVAAVSVAADATRFTLALTVDARRPVGTVELPLMLRTNQDPQLVRLPLEVTAPAEEAPRLTSATPPDMAWGRPVDIVLSGSGLSGTTSVVLRPASGKGEARTAALISATASEAAVHLNMPYRDTLPSDFVLELTTAAGTATLPFEVSTLHVDPVRGSDRGRGTRTSPFATLFAARTACSACDRPLCEACPIFLSPGVHRPGTFC